MCEKWRPTKPIIQYTNIIRATKCSGGDEIMVEEANGYLKVSIESTVSGVHVLTS